MNYIYAKSIKGYSHNQSNKPCEDYSLSYSDKYRKIIIAADGHGGDLYLRSERGSYFAGIALLHVFLSLSNNYVNKLDHEEVQSKLKLSLLCEWNKLIEQDLKRYPLRKKDIEKLSDDDQDLLLNNPIKAYGTTLTGALLILNHLVVVSIGDTEALLENKGEVTKVFLNNEEPVANITYSLCQEDAFKYLNVALIDFNKYDALIIGSDGLTSPYQSYDNFNQSFIKPLIKDVVFTNDLSYVDDFLYHLGSKLGNGDDVSLAYIIKDSCFKKYYLDKK